MPDSPKTLEAPETQAVLEDGVESIATPAEPAPPDTAVENVPVDSMAILAELEREGLLDPIVPAPAPKPNVLDTIDKLRFATGMKFKSRKQEATRAFLTGVSDLVTGNKKDDAPKEDAVMSATSPSPPPEPKGPEGGDVGRATVEEDASG